MPAGLLPPPLAIALLTLAIPRGAEAVRRGDHKLLQTKSDLRPSEYQEIQTLLIMVPPQAPFSDFWPGIGSILKFLRKFVLKQGHGVL